MLPQRRRRLIQGGLASGLVLFAAWSLVSRPSPSAPPHAATAPDSATAPEVATAPESTAAPEAATASDGTGSGGDSAPLTDSAPSTDTASVLAATAPAPIGSVGNAAPSVALSDSAAPGTAAPSDSTAPGTAASPGDSTAPVAVAAPSDSSAPVAVAAPSDSSAPVAVAAPSDSAAPVVVSDSAPADAASATKPEVPLSALLGTGTPASPNAPEVPLSVLLGGGDGEPEGPSVSDGAETATDAPSPPAEPAGNTLPAFSDRYFPFLADEHERGSISVGDTSYGYLIGARHIEEGASLGILPRQKARDLGYGTDQIVGLLEDAAKRFHGRTKTRFWIGNIARRSGGDIPYSVSHNSGRDADVALAYTDAAGAPTDPPDLLSVDPYGTTRDKEHKYRFDAPRTWQIIRALLESDKAQIEYLFLARALTEKVLRHATEKKEPTALIERATTLILQPGGAPHDDHLHVRVYCSERDVEGGCLNTGAIRAGVRLHTSARARRIERSIEALKSDAVEQRARGIERLVLLQANDHKDDIAPMLDDAEGRVRAAAASAFAQWGAAEEAGRIARKLQNEPDPVARAAEMEALSAMGGTEAGEFFASALDHAGTLPWGRVAEAAAQPGSPTPFLMLAEALSPLPLLAPHIDFMAPGADEPSFAMKLYIIDAAGFCDRPEPVAPLFSLLVDTDPVVRAHAAQALSRLLNRPIDPRLSDPNAPTDVVLSAAVDLQNQAQPLHRGDRASWIVEGFSRAGFKVPRIEADHAWEILRAFGAGEPYSYNAGRALTRVAIGSAEPESGKKRPARPPVFEETVAECRYWLKWLEGRRSKLHLPKPPDNIGAACK